LLDGLIIIALADFPVLAILTFYSLTADVSDSSREAVDDENTGSSLIYAPCPGADCRARIYVTNLS